jgi:hypothetical protein
MNDNAFVDSTPMLLKWRMIRCFAINGDMKTYQQNTTSKSGIHIVLNRAKTRIIDLHWASAL